MWAVKALFSEDAIKGDEDADEAPSKDMIDDMKP
jgi:hypothetical protein